MKNHLPDFHFAGSGFHFLRRESAHNLHLNHYFAAITHATHMPHPLHWAYVLAQDLYLLHLFHRAHMLVQKIYMSHAGHWISDYAMILALLLTIALSYTLYVVLSKIEVNDYTSGVWALFG